MYNPTGHIITSDLNIIYKNFSTVRDVLVKVPIYHVSKLHKLET